MNNRKYIVVFDGKKDGQSFLEEIFTTGKRNLAIKTLKKEWYKLKNDEDFFLHKYMRSFRKKEIPSWKDIPLPAYIVNGETKLNQATLAITIDFGEDERDLSGEYLFTFTPKRQKNIKLNFVMEEE